ncbi:unnamed protein product [Medioppia subpectinata]|uniref:Strictosidine synthase conserved region domain-containing protein n=1 Tax=Medioppia subpectinata TaxID=1979941 RepID=A0A7R9PVA2_9ACAR|nr:unnamed protein product [Medioppia subpectinata]CAG2102611.1 unnamed protein product [Medioppia subpectinata]
MGPTNTPALDNFPIRVLTPNNILSRATKICENGIVGPTSLAIHKHYIYTGTAGGGVYRCDLRSGNATRIVKVANDLCKSKAWDISLCGRALGIRTDKKGTVFFVDAYLGLHEVLFVGNKVQVNRLLTLEETGGKYMGHLAIDEGSGTNGGNVIYITIASTKRDLNQWPAMIIEPDRTGTVIKYDADTKKVENLMQGLWYPTSVEITDDRNALLVAEFTARRVVKHYIKGKDKGKTETWAENLPGESDHLIRSLEKHHETYWMPIINARNVSNPNLIDWMSDKPWLRQELLDKYTDIGNSIEELGKKEKNDRLEKLGFSMKTGSQFYTQNVANNYGLILEIDANGKILGSIHSTDGANSFISEAVEGPSDNPYERVLYIGSFSYPYILKLTIPNFSQDMAPFEDQNFDFSYRQPISGLNDFRIFGNRPFNRGYDYAIPDI